MERKVHGGINGPHAFGRSRKRARQYINPQHEHEIAGSGTFAEGVDALLHGDVARNDHGVDAGHHESHGEREVGCRCSLVN